MPSDAALVTIAQRFFDVDAADDVTLRRYNDENHYAEVGDETCVFEPQNAMPDTHLATPASSGVRRPWSAVEIVGLRLPGPTVPRAMDGGFAVFPNGDVLQLAPRRFDHDAAPYLAAYWHRINAIEPQLAPIALAHAAVLFARRDLGVQHLMVVREDLSCFVNEARFDGIDRLQPLTAQRGPGLALGLSFCSIRYLMSEISVSEWRVDVDADGVLTHSANLIADGIT